MQQQTGRLTGPVAAGVLAIAGCVNMLSGARLAQVNALSFLWHGEPLCDCLELASMLLLHLASLYRAWSPTRSHIWCLDTYG